jgi:hypothetical protein
MIDGRCGRGLYLQPRFASASSIQYVDLETVYRNDCSIIDKLQKWRIEREILERAEKIAANSLRNRRLVAGYSFGSRRRLEVAADESVRLADGSLAP